MGLSRRLEANAITRVSLALTMTVPRHLDRDLRFVEEQTSEIVRARREGWYPDAISAMESDRNDVAQKLRDQGYVREVDQAIARGDAERAAMRTANKKTKGSKRALRWNKKTSKKGNVIYEAKLPRVKDVQAIVGQYKNGWVVGLYNERTDALWVYPDFVFGSPDAAKLEVEHLVNANIADVRREANRDVGDIVLAAEQYYDAQQEELDLMKRGTPSQLSQARKRTKQAKEALEDMTGANRELYGSMGGATLGAALGALIGNPFAAAIGALAGSVAGSLLGRPSLPERPPDGRAGGEREGAEVIPMHRRPFRPSRGGYAANRGN